MKTCKKIAAALLLFSMVFVLVSCGTFGTIKKNFEKAGYTYVKSDDDSDNDAKQAQLVVAELEDGNITCTTHIFKKDGAGLLGLATYAFVLEFKSEADLQKALDENGSATLKGLVHDAQNSKYVNGNCILIPSLIGNSEKTEIFNKK